MEKDRRKTDNIKKHVSWNDKSIQVVAEGSHGSRKGSSDMSKSKTHFVPINENEPDFYFKKLREIFELTPDVKSFNIGINVKQSKIKH